MNGLNIEVYLYGEKLKGRVVREFTHLGQNFEVVKVEGKTSIVWNEKVIWVMLNQPKPDRAIERFIGVLNARKFTEESLFETLQNF